MSIFKLKSPPRGFWGAVALALGASLSACAHPVVVEPVLGVRAHSGSVVVQYGHALPAVPLWEHPPVVVHRPVVVPVPVYPAYRHPQRLGGHGWEHGRRHGDHRRGYAGHHGH